MPQLETKMKLTSKQKQLVKEYIKKLTDNKLVEYVDERKPPAEVTKYIKSKLRIKRLLHLGRDIYSRIGYTELASDSAFLGILKKYKAEIKKNEFDTPNGFEINFND